jgi:mono/diheme cytochrome c family protein
MPARGGSRISDREVEAVAAYVVQLAKQPKK